MNDTSINPDNMRSVGSGRRKFHFRPNPDEIHGTAPAGQLMHLRIREGDHLQEGEEEPTVHDGSRAVGSPALTQWVVTEITSETVTGREIESGENHQWRRNQLESALAIGRLSTNLTGVEAINIIEIDGDQVGSIDNPAVKAIVYGDNGNQYYRTYRSTDGGDQSDLELWKEDPSVEQLNDEIAQKLDQVVRNSLIDSGYTVER